MVIEGDRTLVVTTQCNLPMMYYRIVHLKLT